MSSRSSIPHFLRVVRSLAKVTGAALPITALATYSMTGAAACSRDEQGIDAMGGHGGEVSTGSGGTGGSGGDTGGEGGDAPDGGKK